MGDPLPALTRLLMVAEWLDEVAATPGTPEECAANAEVLRSVSRDLCADALLRLGQDMCLDEADPSPGPDERLVTAVIAASGGPEWMAGPTEQAGTARSVVNALRACLDARSRGDLSTDVVLDPGVLPVLTLDNGVEWFAAVVARYGRCICTVDMTASCEPGESACELCNVLPVEWQCPTIDHIGYESDV